MVAHRAHLSRYTLFVLPSPPFFSLQNKPILTIAHAGCYPFATTDPFILHKTPHVYFIGNQDRFETTLVKSEDGEGGEKSCRVVLVPRFCETGEIVLVRCGGEREVRVLRFGVEE